MSLESDSACSNDKGVMAAGSFDVDRLPGATFGGLVRFRGASGSASAAVAAAEAEPEALPRALYASQGLLLLPGMQPISEEPKLLVRLSRLFGTDVENYRETLTAANMIHPEDDVAYHGDGPSRRGVRRRGEELDTADVVCSSRNPPPSNLDVFRLQRRAHAHRRSIVFSRDLYI